MKRVALIVCLLCLSACATTGKTADAWLTQVQQEAGDRAEVVVKSSAMAVLRLPMYYVAERTLTCNLPTGDALATWEVGIEDAIWNWHMKVLNDAGLSVAVGAASTLYPDSVVAWRALLKAAVEAEVEASRLYCQITR